VDGFWKESKQHNLPHNHKVKTEGQPFVTGISEIQNNDRGLGKCRQQQTNVKFVANPFKYQNKQELESLQSTIMQKITHMLA